MKTEKRAFGDKGEDIAKDFLIKKGFKVVEGNYQKPWGEIDIIAKRGNEYHFIEVKTQNVKDIHDVYDFYEAEERVDFRKRARLSRIIQTYLLEKKLLEVDYCVDVIALYINKNNESIVRVEFIEDIYL